MRFITINARNYREVEYIRYLPEEVKREIDIVSSVIPFKTNNYVVDYLIDWENYENDPIYILNFPNKNMMKRHQYEKLKDAYDRNLPKAEIDKLIFNIRMDMNPHPAQQMTNVPNLNGEELKGVQHKYRDIVLFFPSQGQTCHAHCTFCFRWPQFVKDMDLKFSMREIEKVIDYIRINPDVNEILFTGGDPMVMDPATIRKYFEAIKAARPGNLKHIRFGTKSLSYWPFAFIPQLSEEGQEMLDLLKDIADSGFHLAFMAHFNHPNELDNEIVQEAIYNIRQAGAEIRTQAPILRHINDDSEVWSQMWKKQVGLGLIPYYMFIERETGPYNYFQIPLARVYELYRNAIRESGSFAKTITGPVMSASKGKAHIMGVMDNPVDGEKYFMMQYVRHRDYKQTYKPFFMEYDEKATWIDQLNEVSVGSMV
ncbi:KamA family radical SAM protein [Alkalitalea saponilacus]|uniref:L-lysine 2,3-aminomutase (EF-P beta-lysylation pathway) n=1 Tax=Alkalitalea saponilacus TaxID=889453 RepID=A0A1T5HET4_9BACT|nr:radical SAM protein [Alkalitalea saponilacus]ASB48078.1 lysine 2,3-aminomutase [Alkalitalea saponilacus]SKC19188.1 L-lysine 2,3-aminomutase (EF-P beta-lysylation pathway) [Alkalitalea saponilacus]